ncbi:MAG: hypothetical protein M3O15_11655 [Acidobacteriota bacterium]|nr:hypothetical protein [Acidobacteriota bacterium]
MKSADLEARGALLSLLADRALASRIEPGLNLEQHLAFVLPYYERCFRENPDGEGSHSRYSAGWDLAHLFHHLWSDPQTRPAVDQIRDWLARLYKSADADLRRSIVDATLEHLFVIEGIAKLFAGWRKDPELRIAHDEAALWKQGLDENHQSDPFFR